eukprot:scaffold2033_cov164-Amphora_coffeaeformis.AAC.19
MPRVTHGKEYHDLFLAFLIGCIQLFGVLSLHIPHASYGTNGQVFQCGGSHNEKAGLFGFQDGCRFPTSGISSRVIIPRRSFGIGKHAIGQFRSIPTIGGRRSFPTGKGS